MTPPEPQSESILYVISDMQTQLKLRGERIQSLEDELTLLRARVGPLQEVVNDFVVVPWVELWPGAKDSLYQGRVSTPLLKRAQVLYSTEQ